MLILELITCLGREWLSIGIMAHSQHDCISGLCSFSSGLSVRDRAYDLYTTHNPALVYRSDRSLSAMQL